MLLFLEGDPEVVKEYSQYIKTPTELEKPISVVLRKGEVRRLNKISDGFWTLTTPEHLAPKYLQIDIDTIVQDEQLDFSNVREKAKKQYLMKKWEIDKDLNDKMRFI